MSFIPYIVFLLSPLFVFISVIFFTSKLAYRSEIIAILASGISFYRILFVPYFISASLLVGLQLYANHYLVPNSNKTLREFENLYIKKNYVNRDKNIHLQIEKDTYVYVGSYNNNDSLATNFTLEVIEDKKLLYKLAAKKAKWNNKEKAWSLTKFQARRVNGMKEHFREGEKMDTIINLHPSDFDRRVTQKEALTTPELTTFIAKERQKGAPFLEFYLVEQHRRSAIPFATFILTIIGLAIASRKVRGGMGFHIFIGIALSSAYIVLLQFSTTFATQGNLSPLLGVWLPNIFFGILSIYLLWKAPK